MPNKSITVLEITTSHIKLAQSKENSSGRIITKLLVREVTSEAPQDIVKSLKELVSSSKLKITRLILSVPRQFLTLRTLRLPSQDNQEIEKMVELQVSQQIPCAREDIVVDYLTVSKDNLNYSRVLLVICQKKIIHNYLKILSDANLKAERLTLSSQGICNWYQHFSRRNNIREPKPVVLLDIDTKNTDICFYDQDNLLFTRSVSFGAADVKSQRFDSLAEELRKTLSTLQKEQLDLEIAKIFITTALEGIKPLIDKLQTEFSSAVELINPLKEVPLDKELIIPLILNEGQCSSSSILGLVLVKAKEEIDLLPPEVKKEQTQKSKIKELIFLGTLLGLLLVLSLGILATRIYKTELYLKKLEATLKETSPKTKEIETTLKKLALVKERLSPQGSSIDMISELYNIIPEGVSLSIFSLEEGKFITLQGLSLAMSDVFNFQSILEKSPYFKNVEVKYASKRRVRQIEVTDFRITCSIDKQKIREP